MKKLTYTQITHVASYGFYFENLKASMSQATLGITTYLICFNISSSIVVLMTNITFPVFNFFIFEVQQHLSPVL